MESVVPHFDDGRKSYLLQMQVSLWDEVLNRVASKYHLTHRESEILSMIALFGYSNREIAESCVISEKTVKNHLMNIMCKMGSSSMRRLLSSLLVEGFQNQPDGLRG